MASSPDAGARCSPDQNVRRPTSRPSSAGIHLERPFSAPDEKLFIDIDSLRRSFPDLYLRPNGTIHITAHAAAARPGNLPINGFKIMRVRLPADGAGPV